MEYYKYWGAIYRKHQKMRPSKRRKINIKGDYAVILDTKSIDNIILSDGTKWKNMSIKWGNNNSFTSSFS
jgi:hypothetical protein